MSHRHRFFGAPDSDDASRITLRDQEAHHALHAVRVRDGDEVAVFDGRGREWTCRVARRDRKTLTLDVAASRTAPEPDHRLVLIVAALHRDKALEDLIQRGTEVGVDSFIFFRAERSDRPVRRTDKWERWAVESCKQCGRLRLPAFDTADSLSEAIGRAPAPLYIASTDSAASPLRGVAGGREASVVIGPEGDFTEAELAAARAAGATPISLGPHVFRSEVAAAVAATIFLYEWGALGPVTV